jgi:hypothetical protein
MSLEAKTTEIFFDCDEFMKEKFPQSANQYSKGEQCQLSHSEMMAIEIAYHHSTHKCFKYYYNSEILGHLKSYFPYAVSYDRFVSLKYRIENYMESFLRQTRLSHSTDGNFIDSSKLEVCHIMRAPSNKVFEGEAKHGKTITGWFFGFKMHLIINHLGHLVDVVISTGKVADNDIKLLKKITENFIGLLIGDKGYISSKKGELKNKGVQLVTKPRKNMKPIPMTKSEKYYLRHRGLIETSNDLLKNKANIQHTRHRSKVNFKVNIWAALIAYTYNDKLPSIKTFMGIQHPDKPVKVALALVA